MFNKTELLMIEMGRNKRWPSSCMITGFTSGHPVEFLGKPVRVRRKRDPVYAIRDLNPRKEEESERSF